MDTTTTQTQVSDSVVVTGSTGVAGQTATFADNSVIGISSVAAPVASATSSEFNDDNISGFFRRPLLINTYTWPSTVAQGVQIQNMDPWFLYLNNSVVLRKTANYYKISGEMVLDVVVQAAPTMYGHAIVQLVPQGNEFYGPPYTAGDTTNSDALDVLPTIYQSTQDMYGDIVPATSETLEFRLPWISPQDSIDLQDIASSGPLGGGNQTQWRFLTHCIAPLSNATNMASIGDVTIRVYARIENVKLSIPLTLQTGEKKKKEQGKVGKFAASVKSVASALVGVPIIGEFAAGVEVVSSAVGAIADWFGFTKVTTIVAAGRVRQETFPALANADGDDTSCPLSMLQGNKVSIDTALFGSGGKVDVESFDDLFRRKTLVDTVTWTTSSAAGTVLKTIPVTPTYCHTLSTGGHFIAYPSPAGFIGTMFTYWRGPMYYEIQVRCSSLHRGMLQVVYHPSSAHDTSDPTNTSYNTSFEIEADGVHTFRVGWAQNVLCRQLQTAFGLFSYDVGDLFYNGYLDIRVFTKLTAPDPAASVMIEVYQFTDGNMVYTSPTVPSTGLSLQASDMSSAMMTELSNLVGNQADDNFDFTSVSGGERIQSVRTLMQRPFPYLTFSIPLDFTAVPTYMTWTYPIEVPWDYGNATYSSIPTRNWIPMSWIVQMFVGWRGSVRDKFVIPSMGAQALGITGANATRVATAVSMSGTSPLTYNDILNGPWSIGTGFAETNTSTAGSLEIVTPYYFPFRYMLSRLKSNSGNLLTTVCTSLTIMAHPPGVVESTDFLGAYSYRSAGPDFSVGRFRFVPRLFQTA